MFKAFTAGLFGIALSTSMGVLVASNAFDTSAHAAEADPMIIVLNK